MAIATERIYDKCDRRLLLAWIGLSQGLPGLGFEKIKVIGQIASQRRQKSHGRLGDLCDLPGRTPRNGTPNAF